MLVETPVGLFELSVGLFELPVGLPEQGPDRLDGLFDLYGSWYYAQGLVGSGQSIGGRR
ncbi:MAG: hypothetical protein [Olavius algarvensis Gamma 1 endosymbiont]|nr:MAG: hypothetical protein [Olavius algarvensis Gamma 1 endosymbiont]